jgi:hypothetical protein
MLRRTREDHVEERAGSHGRQEVRANAADAVAEAVGAGVLGGIERDVGGDDTLCSGPRRCQRQDAGPGADIDHALASEVEGVDELGEALA